VCGTAAWLSLVVSVQAPDPDTPPPPMKPFPAGCTFQPMTPSSCYTDHDDSGRYPKYAGPRALPNDPPGCGMIGKKVEGSPVCVGEKMSPEYCAQACWTWRGYTMSATATGSECWCGDSINPASVQEAEDKCTTACKGDDTKKCGGYWLVNIGQLYPPGCASSDAGWMLVGVLLGGSSLYFVLGTLFNMQSRGKPAGLQALPHLEYWQSLGGLVQDGVGFAGSRLQGRRGGGGARRSAYSSVKSEATKSGGGREKGSKKEKKEKEKEKEKEKAKDRKKDKSEKKKEATQQHKEEPQRGVAAAAGPAPDQQTAGGPRQTASGGGGRWVHVPT
jgi:hypothetical protein